MVTLWKPEFMVMMPCCHAGANEQAVINFKKCASQ